MKRWLKNFAYKHSWTETQMLIDKLEQTPSVVGFNPQRAMLTTSNLIQVALHGAFPLIDRVAIALTISEIRKHNTKFRIVNAIFEGDMEAKRDGI